MPTLIGRRNESSARSAILIAASRGRVGNEDGELVAPEPGHGIGLADDLLKAPCHLDKGLVTTGMSQAVVDVLEPVEVEREERGRETSVVESCERLADPVAQQGAVGQPGQGVGQGLLAQLLLRLLEREGALGDALLKSRVEGLQLLGEHVQTDGHRRHGVILPRQLEPCAEMAPGDLGHEIQESVDERVLRTQGCRRSQ